ncbi:MAG TPA: YciI family protein [Verrucomicrobiae bacterium]|nr:YciI family protein [Verrucomicrobiae bacterium]
MKFMVIVKEGKGCDGGKLPRQEFLAAMGKYNEELTKAGVFLALEGLTPASAGTRVKFADKKPIVTDGPFAESKELVGGFWLWKCQSKQEAIEWLKRAPFEETEVEIREVLEPEDFADVFARAYREEPVNA